MVVTGTLCGIEMETLLYILGYLVCGYLTFRGWLKVSPPANGKYSNDNGGCNAGWYIPAVWQTSRRMGYARGMAVLNVFWLCIALWWGVLAISGLFGAGVFIGGKLHTLCEKITDYHVPEPVDTDLAKANKEVEELLA